MRILLFGATGMVGSRIAAEAVRRGHEVTAASRSGAAPKGVAGPVVAVAADGSDTAAVARLAKGLDVVASAMGPARDGSDQREPFEALNHALVDGVRTAGVPRLVVVGGAGGLEVGPGKMLMDTPDFPEAYRGEALAHHDVLTFYRNVRDLDWTYVSPAAEIAPGERTGAFRVGGDRLLSDPESGESRISAEDYAIAFVDEIESGGNPRTRISVAY